MTNTPTWAQNLTLDDWKLVEWAMEELDNVVNDHSADECDVTDTSKRRLAAMVAAIQQEESDND